MERLGINNKTLSGYETGKSEPDIGTINLLCDLYGVSSDWLLGRTKFKNIYSIGKTVNIDLTGQSFVAAEIIFKEKNLNNKSEAKIAKNDVTIPE